MAVLTRDNPLLSGITMSDLQSTAISVPRSHFRSTANRAVHRIHVCNQLQIPVQMGKGLIYHATWGKMVTRTIYISGF